MLYNHTNLFVNTNGTNIFYLPEQISKPLNNPETRLLWDDILREADDNDMLQSAINKVIIYELSRKVDLNQ